MSGSQRGFTLIELVLAVAIIGGAFLSLLWMRTAAVSRAGQFSLDRKIQRLAQEKLDEVMYGVEEDISGAVEELPGGEWEVDVANIGNVEAPLFACTITIRYLDADEEVQEYTLQSWIMFPPQESILNTVVDSQLGSEEGFR